MKVTISIGGRFHAFDMAAQLERRGHLQRLVTSYPASKVLEWPIPAAKVRTVLSHELLCRGYRMAAARLGLRYDPQVALNGRFDRISSGRIPADADIVVAWSGMARRTLARAREQGAVAVLERNSSHIEYYRGVLIEEAELFGGVPQLPDPAMVDRELAEYAEADYICLPSTFALESFVRRGVPREKLFMVPFGVEMAQFPEGKKPDEVFRIIHCGGLTLRKGVHYLLQAFHELRLPNAELWLIGAPSGEIRPYLDRYGSAAVQVKGTFPQAQLHEQYAMGSVFCLASIEDGFAMVLSQAMACGLPVVCTENTAAHDLVRDGIDGYVLPIRDVEALKARLAAMHADPERTREMGRQARQRIAGARSWDHYGDHLVREYERVLAGRGVPAGAAAGEARR